MRIKRAYIIIAVLFSVPLIYLAIAISSRQSSDDPPLWGFFRSFPSKWEGPAENASSSNGAIETVFATEYVELELSGGSSTPTSQIELDASPTIEVVTAIAEIDARCRHGPDMVFQVRSYLRKGDAVTLVAQSIGGDWYLALLSGSGFRCWVWKDLLFVAGDIDTLEIDLGPPLPTLTSIKPPENIIRTGCWVLNDPQYPNGICKPLPCRPNDVPATVCDLP